MWVAPMKNVANLHCQCQTSYFAVAIDSCYELLVSPGTANQVPICQRPTTLGTGINAGICCWTRGTSRDQYVYFGVYINISYIYVKIYLWQKISCWSAFVGEWLKRIPHNGSISGLIPARNLCCRSLPSLFLVSYWSLCHILSNKGKKGKQSLLTSPF